MRSVAAKDGADGRTKGEKKRGVKLRLGGETDPC